MVTALISLGKSPRRPRGSPSANAPRESFVAAMHDRGIGAQMLFGAIENPACVSLGVI
jgi:hypothetical protein